MITNKKKLRLIINSFFGLFLVYFFVIFYFKSIEIIRDSNLKLPAENFVLVNIDRYIKDYEKYGIPIYQSRLASHDASGLIFKSIGNYSYILTAEHFCSVIDKDTEFNIPVSEIENVIYITDIHYKDTRSKILFTDPLLDLCLMSIPRVDNAIDISISKRMPRMGETVYALSSPAGYLSQDSPLHLEGMYSGCNITECVFSIPAYPGSSGSIILNKRNKIVGMIQSSLYEFNDISMGVGRDDIYRFLKLYKENYGIDIID